MDITASHLGRDTIVDVVKKVASKLFIPLTVGGGIRTLDDISRLLNAGCDKVSLNSSAIQDPNLIDEAAKKFGSQCVVVAIDAKKIENGYSVFINGGRIDTKKDTFAWAKEVESRGAGEILLTSMDNDGVKQGFNLELTKIFSTLSIPTIASGGAGKMEHFKEAFEAGADACLAASIFHFGEIEIKKLKEYLKANGVEVRL